MLAVVGIGAARSSVAATPSPHPLLLVVVVLEDVHEVRVSHSTHESITHRHICSHDDDRSKTVDSSMQTSEPYTSIVVPVMTTRACSARKCLSLSHISL